MSATRQPRAVSPASFPASRPTPQQEGARRHVHEQRSHGRRDAPAPGPSEQRGPVVPGDGRPPGQRRRPGVATAGEQRGRAPLPSSAKPTSTRGPFPATSYSPLPDTVPVPTERRSTPAKKRAPKLEKGTAPAPKPIAIATTGRKRCTTSFLRPSAPGPGTGTAPGGHGPAPRRHTYRKLMGGVSTGRFDFANAIRGPWAQRPRSGAGPSMRQNRLYVPYV